MQLLTLGALVGTRHHWGFLYCRPFPGRLSLPEGICGLLLVYCTRGAVARINVALTLHPLLTPFALLDPAGNQVGMIAQHHMVTRGGHWKIQQPIMITLLPRLFDPPQDLSLLFGP